MSNATTVAPAKQNAALASAITVMAPTMPVAAPTAVVAALSSPELALMAGHSLAAVLAAFVQ